MISFSDKGAKRDDAETIARDMVRRRATKIMMSDVEAMNDAQLFRMLESWGYIWNEQHQSWDASMDLFR